MDNNQGKKVSLLPIILALVIGAVLGWLIRGSSGGGGTSTLTPAPPVAEATPSPSPQLVAPSPTATCVPLQPYGEHTISVGPSIDTVNPDCLTINARLDKIRWIADLNAGNLKGRELWIEFQEKPFKTMALGVHAANRATCNGDTCTSGQIQSTWPPDAEKNSDGHYYKTYKYWQVFHDPKSSANDIFADGRIIIQW